MENNIKKIQKIIYKKVNLRKKFLPKSKRAPVIGVLAFLIVLSAIIGGSFGAILTNFYWQENYPNLNKNLVVTGDSIVKNNYVPQTTEEEKTIKTVEQASPSVVSIIISKDVPILEKYYIDPFGSDFFGGLQIPKYREKGTEKKEVGGGTGFIISEDGMILTNKHVVLEEDAEYTVLLNDGEKYPAKILDTDPFYDLAIIKIDQSEKIEEERKSLTPVQLGDSSKLQIGQTVIAIGNALGEFQNTVSVGVVSGLGRNIVATGAGTVESLEGIIQTDAAINPGNSGGPLLNLAGEVIGINVARSTSGENIGFSLPINMAKRDIEQIKTIGKIIYPFLGIYYTAITKEISEANDLSVDYGIWVGRDAKGEKTEIAVVADSPAEKAELKRDDIILEFDNTKITKKYSLAKTILQYSPEDKVSLKILRDGKEIIVEITLSERED
jgi:S1-C subfamily serine protease